jgi:hypothetical protein
MLPIRPLIDENKEEENKNEKVRKKVKRVKEKMVQRKDKIVEYMKKHIKHINIISNLAIYTLSGTAAVMGGVGTYTLLNHIAQNPHNTTASYVAGTCAGLLTHEILKKGLRMSENTRQKVAEYIYKWYNLEKKKFVKENIFSVKKWLLYYSPILFGCALFNSTPNARHTLWRVWFDKHYWGNISNPRIGVTGGIWETIKFTANHIGLSRLSHISIETIKKGVMNGTTVGAWSGATAWFLMRNKTRKSDAVEHIYYALSDGRRVRIRDVLGICTSFLAEACESAMVWTMLKYGTNNIKQALPYLVSIAAGRLLTGVVYRKLADDQKKNVN